MLYYFFCFVLWFMLYTESNLKPTVYKISVLQIMGWHASRKLSHYGFHTLASRFTPKVSIFQPSLKNCQSGYLNSCSKGATFNGFTSFSSISQRLSKRGFEVNKSFHFHNAKRFYYVDHQNVHHFKPRGAKHWFQTYKYVFILLMVSFSGVFITFYLDNLETVPYTMRTHLILMSKASERRLGESGFQQMKRAFKGKILPSTNPQCVRVRIIAKDIVDALYRGLRREKVWSDVGYELENINTMFHVEENEIERETLTLTMSGLGEENEGMVEVERKWDKEDEILDDKWVEESRKKGKEKRLEPTTSHLDGLNWEILVVNEPHLVNAYCFAGGKIVVFTGLLEHLKSDDEIATIIAHEVGHAVARHIAERATHYLWFLILQSILSPFFSLEIIKMILSLFFKLPFSRRNEMEADYIGILLMASAGYDPRVAPKLHEKFKVNNRSMFMKDYLSTHPSHKERAKLLARAKTMEEALSIYKDARAGRAVEGFL